MIYLCIGRRQLGKTTLAYSMARKCPARIIFDPRGLVASDGLRVQQTKDLDLAIDALAERRIEEIVITPDTNVQQMFNATAIHVKSWSQEFEHADRKQRALMFLIDEARFVDLHDSPGFEYIARAVPPDLVHIVLTAHRPIDIPTDVRAISDHWLMFRCTQEHDLKCIADRAGERVRAEVQALNPHEFIDWDDATATWKAYKDPSRWYVPLKSQAKLGADPEFLPANESAPESGENKTLDRRLPLL